MGKVLNNFIDFEDDILEQLKDEEFQKMYLSGSLNDYLEDNDFTAFFRALERVVKARCSVSKFCKDASIGRNSFYSLVRGDKKPQLETVLKMLNQLGFELKVA
jgi:probable addiction module antidote protein